MRIYMYNNVYVCQLLMCIDNIIYHICVCVCVCGPRFNMFRPSMGRCHSFSRGLPWRSAK